MFRQLHFACFSGTYDHCFQKSYINRMISASEESCAENSQLNESSSNMIPTKQRLPPRL